ncbi:MAG: hypothetical protein QOE05_2918 [Actinomycetota bacterium]|jgi:hypothetical protein|nr:hypothetical protein [Actinomycetota bacterium]
MVSGDDVQLPDLQVIQRYSLAVRGATAPVADVVAALQADLAWLTGTGRRRAVEPAAPSAPTKNTATKNTPAKNTAANTAPTRTAPARKAASTTTPAKRTTKTAAKKSPAKTPAARKSGARRA